MTKKEIRKYFLVYTILSLLLMLGAYAPFAGKTFVCNGDALHQHCRALLYYSEWLREIWKNLVTKGRLVIPQWDFSIGYGSNILTTLHYYAIGDPLALFSVFVPSRYIPYFYSFLVLMRNYLSGITFSLFCIYLGKKQTLALLSGAFVYAFCGHALLSGPLHPFFVNPMIYFPLILLGVEKVLRGEKPYVLCLSVFAAAVSNFYFFYMIVLETIIYVLVRCCVLYGWKRKREFGAAILKIGIYSLIGVLLASVILLPVILVYLNDYRVDKEYVIDLFYDLKYYAKIPAAFVSRVSMGYSAILGCGVPALMAVFLLFFGKDRKKYRPEEKALFIIGSLLLIFPAAAHVLNGFAYVSNRWVWGYSLLVAFILCDTWEELTAMQRRDAKRLLIFLAGYAGVLIVLAAAANKLWGISMSGMLSALPYLGIACILSAGCLLQRNRIPVRAIKAILFMLTFAGLIQNFHDMYGRGGNEESSYKTAEQVNNFYNRKAGRIVQKLQEQEKTFFRYTGNALDDNAAVNQGTHSMKYFWSLSNRNISEFLIETQAYVLRLYHYKDLNERTILTTLAGNRYYLCNAKKEQVVPYGYQKISEEDGVCVYENMYALPLGYCYDSMSFS